MLFIDYLIENAKMVDPSQQIVIITRQVQRFLVSDTYRGEGVFSLTTRRVSSAI